MFADYEAAVRPSGCPTGGAFHLVHQPESPPPVSTAIVVAVSSLTGLEPTHMRPLNDVVDPDALNRHVDEIRNRSAVLSFEFHGYRVAVRGDGHVEFTAVEESEPTADGNEDAAPH